ncbi:cyclase family protein, partial [Methanobrevibacter sp. OttesenSCG-928-K11]|nr:cyclase family protein [Methanobrevibacter sp. OttesenSCG-928-K11]
TPSVDMYGKNQIHKLLLKNNIWIVENLTNTNKLIKKEYDAFFIPMNISSEASYVRSFVKK